MGQKKLIRFEAIKGYENVFEYPLNAKGTWNNFFKNNNPITLELACGKGEYAVGLGKMHPNRNFIGIDIKGNRIWRGATNALELGLTNVAFIRSLIDKVPDYFNPTEIDEIWITFPDPQLRWSKAKKRLTHPKFLRLYQQFLKKSDPNLKTGITHLKTDSPNLYLFTLKVIELYGLHLLYKTDNLYAQATIDPRCLIKTYYEGKDIAQSNQIHYIQFTLDKELPIELDEVLKEAIKDIPMDAGELLRMQSYEQE